MIQDQEDHHHTSWERAPYLLHLTFHMSESSTKRSPQSNSQLLPNQKMRTTCNACQQAKIRCSHTHPCQRCESHGYQCVYSVSQPLGRPAKKKTTRPAPAGVGMQMRRGEGEVVDRLTRRSAARAPKRASTMSARRARRVPSWMPSPSTLSGSGVSERDESHKSDCGTGTEVTPAKEEAQWPSLTEWFSDIPGEHKPNPWDVWLSIDNTGTCRDSFLRRLDPRTGIRQRKRGQYSRRFRICRC